VTKPKKERVMSVVVPKDLAGEVRRIAQVTGKPVAVVKQAAFGDIFNEFDVGDLRARFLAKIAEELGLEK
jgi:hypothetical protein